jgi:hypothetical protein
VLHNTLDKDEGSAEVDVQRVIEFLEGNVPHIGEALAVTGVGDENVRSLAVLFVNLLEHGFNLVGGADVDLVDGDAELVLCVFGLEVFYDCVHGVEVGGVGQGEMDAMLCELVCTS